MVEMDWYYNTSDDSYEGPIATKEIKEKIKENVITEGTLVWKDGMTDWQQISDVPEFEELFQAPKPPPLPKEKFESNRKEQELSFDATEVKQERDSYKGAKNDKLYIEKGANLNNEREGEDLDENAKEISKDDYSLKWYYWILVSLVLGVLSIMAETVNPSFYIPSDSRIMFELISLALIIFHIVVFIGLYKFKIWALYSVLFYLVLHTLIGIILFSVTSEIPPPVLILIGGIYLVLNYLYFMKRKPLFS